MSITYFNIIFTWHNNNKLLLLDYKLISYTIVGESSTLNNLTLQVKQIYLVILFSYNISPLHSIKIIYFLSKLLAFVLSYLKAHINRDFFLNIISFL